MPDHERIPTSPAGRAVVAVNSIAEYVEAAAGVDISSGSIPVLQAHRGPVPAMAVALPVACAHRDDNWTGTVFVCDEELTPVGEVLGRSTGRPVREGTIAAATALSRSGPVTVVARSMMVTPERLAAMPVDARLGFVTGADFASVSALVARSVRHGPAAVGRLRDLRFDTLTDEETTPDRLTGASVTPSALRAAVADGVAVLVGRSHGRECLMHLRGGGICGRAEERPLLPVLPPVGSRWAEHPTACQQSDRCCRDDTSIGDHLRAADIPAAIAVLDGCRTAVAGGGKVRSEASIPLAMLDGMTLAVAVTIGMRGGCPHAGPLFRALLYAGLSLGEACAEVNGALAADPAGVGRLMLFGDAGLIPVPSAADPFDAARRLRDGERLAVPASSAALLVTGGLAIAAEPGGPLPVPRPDARSSWVLTEPATRPEAGIVLAPERLDARWHGRIRPWIERMRELPEMGLKVDHKALDVVARSAVTAVRARAEADHLAAAEAAVAAFATAQRDLAALQARLIEDEVQWASGNLYNFVDGWPQPWDVRMAPVPEICPQCRDRAAMRHRVRSGRGAGTDLCYVVCYLCSEVLAGVEDFPAEVTVEHPPEVRRGTTFEVSVSVTAPVGIPLDVAVGVTFTHEKRFHCSISDTLSFGLGPGRTRLLRFCGTSDAERAIPDWEPLTVMVAADGAVRFLLRSVWLRT
ncbi:hypothetical protein [Micromonospora sp. NBRC 101691]|uniref:hypothetical protein n=1 Tax=Micromonospora TaxID=1873 RepID=UPI0024A5FDA6|nr:hypothetical protein [Micromonospora sp. NBRC 101691]GLY26202.1 hypothetical protein Misp04_59330 [Micromonospora sp. NBRC 101691]